MKILIIILCIAVAGLVFFTEELYRYVFCRGSSRLFIRLFDSKGHEEGYYRYRDEGKARFSQVPCQRLTLENDRGQKLAGFYYPCGSEGKKIAFIVHGYRSDHLETGAMVYDYYKSRGIDFFCCDHTAIGESEGHFIGYDVLETRDCLRWIDLLREKFGDDTKIILHGFSMGAATVLQMSGKCPPNVRFIVSDSAYCNAHAAMDHQVGPFFGPLRLINRIVAGYDWNDSDVTESLRKSHIPILFVHGRDDKLVPYENGPRLYELYQGEKDCLFPEHTRHIETMYTSSAQYEEKLDSFAGRFL